MKLFFVVCGFLVAGAAAGQDVVSVVPVAPQACFNPDKNNPMGSLPTGMVSGCVEIPTQAGMANKVHEVSRVQDADRATLLALIRDLANRVDRLEKKASNPDSAEQLQ